MSSVLASFVTQCIEKKTKRSPSGSNYLRERRGEVEEWPTNCMFDCRSTTPRFESAPAEKVLPPFGSQGQGRGQKTLVAWRWVFEYGEVVKWWLFSYSPANVRFSNDDDEVEGRRCVKEARKREASCD
jgi:hypothetical protein